MSPIVTDVEGASAHRAPRSSRRRRGIRHLRRSAATIACVGPLALLTAIAAPSPGQAATVGSLQAQADRLQQQIQSTGAEISALGQRYDQAQDELASIDEQITATKDKIASDQHHVAVDQLHLRSAAVYAYMSVGMGGADSPLFSGNQRTYAAAQEYGQVATGNLDVTLAQLHTAQVSLSAARANLLVQQGSAQAALNAAAEAQEQANQQQGALNADLSEVKGQLGVLEQQAQDAADAAEGAVNQAVLVDGANFPPPPSAGSAAGVAVQAAETQLGVPYVWGGTSPRGTPGDPSGGFDCSGLVMWAWAQAGVDLPHYSGSQFDDTAPVPVPDMEPGDILFYGPGGDQHEAMYVGGGEMIEAPETGEVVHITPIRLGDGFSGVHRP
jgi:cell wall-associated NlpC family hydrolase